ncbi:uncharacterized protein LOC1274591 isoform X2 [Anopheles gambiae]|uniref:uncharacterized protein LOC1274591 isoform X2 n=1 Tax=Anopheles gambiae TaxID=7165 RepID=UPI002AC8FACF|nr:uncharacterized protein LOC1274591 isoform X2 [Anopheles gambiae]
MKPKKQQTSASGEKKSSGGGGAVALTSSTVGSTGNASAGPVGTDAKSNPSSSSSSTASAKKPVKRLQSKTKEGAPNLTAASGAAVSNTSAVNSGGKSTEKISNTNQQCSSQQHTPQSGKSKFSATVSKSVSGGDSPDSSKIDAKPLTESETITSSSTTCITGVVVGKSETLGSLAGKGNKQHVAKANKIDSVNSPTSQNTTVKATGKDSANRSRKSTKETVGATKRNTGQTEKSDAAKRKLSDSGCNSSTVCSVGDLGDNRSMTASIPTSSSIESKLREKEKKIQKELKNLGVPDKTINQSIDAAYLLKSAEESVVNPSISEMVKTKSRTTVAQGKYGGGGADNTAGTGAVGRKPSVTSEEPAPSVEGESVEKSTKESISSGGKSKKTVTLKVDQQPAEGQKKMSGKGSSTKDVDEKLASKSTRKDDKTTPTSGSGGNAAAVKTSSTKGAGQGAKSNKKANNSSGSSDLKQNKPGISESVSKITEQQKMDGTSELPVVKQSAEQEGSLTIGRGSSIEQEDQEEKNEEVHIRIDSIVKALEREDIETSSAIKKESADESKKDGSGDGVIAIPAAQSKSLHEIKTKKQPTPRKPSAKKDCSAASSKSKAKEMNEKKKAAVVDQVCKKEVKFQEQPPPASPAKRKYAKKPKSGTEDTGSGEKPAKMAKSTTPKKVNNASKVKQANVKTNTKTHPLAATEPSLPLPSVVNDETSSTVPSKDIKAIDSSFAAKEEVASTATAVSNRDRSSTENDDDVPLRQLQQKQNPVQSVMEATGSSTVKNLAISQPSQPKDGEKAQDQTEERTKEDSSDVGPETNVPQSASGPILAGLLKSSGKQGKRSYARKNSSSGTSGKSTKVSVSSGPCSVPAVPEECHSKEGKLEKKDVYDFDDSESEIDAPVKAGKPNFKRKSSVDVSQSREDISRDTTDDSLTAKPKIVEGKKEEIRSNPPGAGSDGEREKADEDDNKKRIVPLKKQKRRIEAALSETVSSMKKEQKTGESSESEKEQDDADLAEKKTKKKAATLTKKLKQEAKEDLHSSADEADDDDEGEDDGEDDEDNGSGDSDGCSSTDTVRTRIAKKRQSAKKRNVKLYGFWSGPKRHRVASLNALAKVHCLYENEMRGALEASLMSQSSGSRVIRTITKDGERIKKERICPEEESAGEESRSGETVSSEMAPHGKGKEPEHSKSKEPERKEPDKKRDEKKETPKQERKEAPSHQQKQADEAAREEVKPKVKEEAPKKDSDQDSAESSEEEPVVMRNLRCAPGLRGAGKHWDPDASSLESEIEQLPDSDETYAQGKDTDPTRKRKVKKKVARKSKAKSATMQTKSEKSEKDKEKSEKASEKQEKAPKPPGKKIKKELKALMTDNERQEEGAASSSSSGSEKVESAKNKQDDVVKKRKREPKTEKAEPGGDYKEYIGKKRMASLNASAMMAATYEVQRVLYRNTDSSDSECSTEKAPKSKKTTKDSKEHKDNAAVLSATKGDTKEKKESIGEKELRIDSDLQASQQASAAPLDVKQIDMSVESMCSNQPSTSNALGTISVAQQEVLTKKKKVVIKTEPMRDRKDDPMEVKREIEEPRPVSSNLVIAQDTEVTITGVYVNSSLGANQEAYCKMQYRVQQSVTEERLVRPGEAPPKSYTPLSALSSMRPPNDQTLSTPPLFVQPAQCDSPLGPPRAFYPPPTSSSGSSSAFCAPMPHDSPGYYQPAGPLISPHLLGQPPSQHGPKSGPDGEALLQSPQQPPASSTADSTDSDVLLTGGGVDLGGHRSQPYGASRYGPATGAGGPPTNLYPRPMQMHCPPTYLPPGYYAPSPYGPQPPPPHGPPPEMYYTHAYSPHYYPKFAPPYYPTSRRYYPGPGPGPEHHLYEQAPPPPSSAQGPPGPPPPPSGAQLVPAGPQGPQHLDHYPYSPYPGYGSPGPGSGGQCYPRNLQHPPPPPAYMDAHYTTNCPCPMQCPKNVNAGSLIGIKASKGPVATNNHIVQNQPSTRISTTTEPITISSSSSSSSASSSSSPAPLDIHAPVVATTTAATTTPVRQMVADAETPPNAAPKQQPHPSHGYHAHHHHGVPLPMEMHSQGPPVHHPHTYPYHYHHHHPGPLHHTPHGPLQTEVTTPQKPAVTATSTSPVTTTISSATKHSTPVSTVSTAATTGINAHHPEKMCYKTELPIKPETATDLLSTPMHYGSPYHHPYHHPMGYYHHAKLADLKEETHHGTLTPPYSISSKMALLETPDMSPVRVSTALNVPPVNVLAKGVDCSDKTHSKDDKLSDIPVSTAIVKQEIEEFKLLEPLVGAVCKKEDFEETGPAMTPDLLDESIVIKKDRDEMKPVDRSIYHPEHHVPVDHHQLHHHLQQVRDSSHIPHHLHHHSASTNLLHGSSPHHHHHLHSHYNVQQQQQQQQPLITGLLVEKDDVKTDAKLPPDSKSLLTELVLTTEASMVETPKMAQSIPAASATTAAAAITSKMDEVCKSTAQQLRGNSSDNSFNLSDSLIPNVAGASEQLSSISKNSGKVQSHDSCAGSLDPPSPVPIPASTVKRRPLLVACKKATPKQSPPNSYKNLIKRTKGLEDDNDPQPQCPEPVELSEEEEEDDEEEEEEEDEDEEDENDEEDDDEEANPEEKVEDVEDIELQEQRLVQAEKRALQSEQSVDQNGRKQRLKKRPVSKPRRKSCRRKLLRTLSGAPTDKKQPKTTPEAVSSVRTRSVKRFYRVFRSSIESLKRLPVSIRERLLRRSSVTLLSIRRNARKKFCKSQQQPQQSQQHSPAIQETKDIVSLSETQPLVAASESEANTTATEVENTLPNCSELLSSNELDLTADTNNTASAVHKNQTVSAHAPVDATVSTLSNVDRTIDLVAKGYFSEPEFFSGTDLQIHSRSWLKKLKQQQQQEGRSHSEQSRGAKGRERNGEGNKKKCKSKCSPLAADVTLPDTPASGTTKSKHSKSKSKSSKTTPTEKVDLVTPSNPECKDTKSTKKTSAKERKKDPSSSRKRKQKAQTDDGDEVPHASKRSSTHNPEPTVSTVESLYHRATSTPIPAPIGEVASASGPDDREEDGSKAAALFDDSVVTLMDQSSVIDDRETDFDDAATMLVEDDVASVDTNVLVNRHNNNNNNNSAVTDKNSAIEEQQRIAAVQLALNAPIQAIIAEGKEGSELEPPEGMEPFMDEPLEEEELKANGQLNAANHQPEATANVLQQPPPCPLAAPSPGDQPALNAHYDDDYRELEEEELLPKRGSSRSVKRRRSRSKTKSKKFSTKKRHRPSTHRNIAAELEELTVPIHPSSSIPRWSNGWTWEGQPFQGMVFLNSDDPPVLRTCYPAMRHPLGDIVKPRDCVLLKAGNKRAELPYVAKVAHLWENPDDGEMMMSLLWYYRPEHTEQGRQRTDGPDEVFASRHKDHNSVACIEDKCYVLTFSEYCRFRKQLKGIEENIDEQPSIVPPLRRENPRLPPPIVSPEAVLYCQRVYEFRHKRLLKCTS